MATLVTHPESLFRDACSMSCMCLAIAPLAKCMHPACHVPCVWTITASHTTMFASLSAREMRCTGFDRCEIVTQVS